MKRILLTFIACMLAFCAWAVPALRTTFTVQQPDGSIITLQLVGDEHFHYYINVDTGEALTLTADGAYVPLSAGELQNTMLIGMERRADANASRVQRLQSRSQAMGPNRVGSMKPTSGNKKGLVILVNYTDKKFLAGHDQAAFYNMFNEEGYSENRHIGSVKDFFRDQSYGNLIIDFDVVGPVTVSHEMAYYGANSNGSDVRPGQMAAEACQLVDNLVNFKDYDWDGDGEVDQVFIIYAGYGEAMGGAADTIWPHEWNLGSATGRNLYLDNVKISTYACSCELRGNSGSTLAPIGTACHEFSHCIGFPDMYDTDYSGSFGMNAWDLMDSGSYNGPSGYGEVPSGYTAYERWQAGWVTPTELTGAKTVKEMKSLAAEPEAYILYNPSNRNEYLIFENRQPQRWFGYTGNTAAGSGLLITHVDYNATSWRNNKVNDDPNHQRCTIIPASNVYGSQYTSGSSTRWSVSQKQYKAMLFPANGVTELSETSHTASAGKWFNGATGLGHTITEITNEGGLVGFKFDGGVPEDDGSRYTVVFDPGTGSCPTTAWTQTYFRERVPLPAATPSFLASDYTFVGWSTKEATGSRPAQLLTAETDYEPTADVTLYAVYRSNTSDGSSNGAGSYTLDYSKENLTFSSYSYSTAKNLTASDGSKWELKVNKNLFTGGLQIDKNKDAYIKVPVCPGPITSVEVTDKTARVLKFALTADDASPAATSTAATKAVLDLSGQDLTTGYLYTTDGSTVITKVVVNYISYDSFTHLTRPEGPATLTVGTLNKAIKGLPSGTTTLNDILIIVDRILQR